MFHKPFVVGGRAHTRGGLGWVRTAVEMQGCLRARRWSRWRSRVPVVLSVMLEAALAIKHAPLIMLHKPFAAGGRAHGWGGWGCERTAKEKTGLVEGKREDVMVFKNTGHLVP